MNYDQKLKELYMKYWDELNYQLGEIESDDFADPFLLSIDEDSTSNNTIKVMIFGQETKGWNGSDSTLSGLMKRYHCYYKGENIRGSFWKGFSFFKNAMMEAYPNKSFHFVWNNISKIGRSNRVGVSPDARTLERKYFSVIADEVKIFDPDIVIFFTGPNRNGDIKHHFKDAEFLEIGAEFPRRALAKVSSSKLPENTIRMYHPSYFGGFNKIRNTALTEILTSIEKS